MSAADKAFNSGVSAAAQIARAAAVAARKSGAGTKWQGASEALAALADDLDTLAHPLPPAMQPVPHGVETVDVDSHRAQARAQGYTGDECRECGSFSMVRNGTCLKCENCGATTGCS